MSVVKLMQGNEACVEGALAAGMRFFAGYPITPSTEIAELSSVKLPKYGGKFIQMEDEIAGMAATIGGSLAGLKSMTATSGPGFSLKQENLGFASMTEVPCVIVNVQRGGPSTGLPTSPSQGDVMQAKWGTHGDHPIIAISPSSVKETYDLTIKAFNLSEQFRVPVILLMDEIVGHMREKIEIEDKENIEIIDRKKPEQKYPNYLPYEINGNEVPAMGNFGEGYRYHVTGLVHDETGFASNDNKVADKLLHRINDKLDIYYDDIVMWEEEYAEDCEILILSFGGVSRAAKNAVKTLRAQGVKVGHFRPISIWPFPHKRLRELSSKINSILVCELNRGQIIKEVESICLDRCDIYGTNKINGEVIYPEEIIAEVINIRQGGIICQVN